MPNIDETYNLPFDEKLIRENLPENVADQLYDQHIQLKKMYEEIAIGVNNTYEMTIISQSKSGVTYPPGQPLVMLPKLGMFFILISGLEDNMPQVAEIVSKRIVGTAASFTNIDNFTPTSGDWTGVSLNIKSLNDEIGVSHSGGASLEGRFNVTIFGPYNPQGGG